MINDALQNRRYIIAIAIVAVVIIFVFRLLTLQIIDSKYKTGADSNAFLKKTQFPPRGLIYDRNDKLLVYNKAAYDIMLIMREIHDLDTADFCRNLNISKEYFDAKIAEIKDTKKNRSYSSYTPQVFMTQLSSADIASLQQSIYKFTGFYLQNRTLRDYVYPSAAHLLGSIGEVSRSKIEKDAYYKQGDYAGRDGIEYTYEEALRGEKGVEILLRDAKGRIKGKYEDGAFDEPPKVGKNLTLTIDIDLQRLGEKLLNGKMGSIVAIEPSTGEILAMVSNPSFNPAAMVGRQRSANYSALLNDPMKPLYNRATQAQYSPGSTFKPLQALVCLQMGGITPDTRFPCNGQGSQPIKCTHSHGSPVSLLSAIEQSCNPYFWQAFRNTLEHNGGYGQQNQNFKRNYETWNTLMMQFGMGARFTDSDLYEQSKGLIPKESFFNRYYGETGWRALTIRSLSIGQGEVLITPLQLTNAMATVANDGFYITPHINRADSMRQYIHKVDINKEHFSVVKEGMWRVFERGTARRYKIPNIEMCGKTGTVQNNHGKDHAVFEGFAPLENPKICVVVVVENAGFGATWAAPIASLMMEYYLTGTIERTDLYERMKTTVLNKAAVSTLPMIEDAVLLKKSGGQSNSPL
ncbi:MAG: penicillin-binding protein 2 [Prevotellaceae bacterium]|jgi:penicillin-binding protein 2|nr:penicillin-binding protein 2 [Prevotellaceae bacterium]